MPIYMTLHHGKHPVRWATAAWIPTTASFLIHFVVPLPRCNVCSWRIFLPWHLVSCWHLTGRGNTVQVWRQLLLLNNDAWASITVFAETTEGLICFCMTVEDRRIKLWQLRQPLFQLFHHEALFAGGNTTSGSSLPAPKTHLEHPSWVKRSFAPADGAVLAIGHRWGGREPDSSGLAHSPNPSNPPSLCTGSSITSCCMVAPRTVPLLPPLHPGLSDNAKTQQDPYPTTAWQNPRHLQVSWQSLVSDWFGVSSFLGTDPPTIWIL